MTDKLIYTQMIAVLKDVEAIEKERENTQGSGYNFRGIDDVYNTMHPLFAKHGVFCVPVVLNVVREDRETRNGAAMIYTMLTVKYVFYASDGSSVESTVVGEAFDSGDKSANKAMSAAMKYAILQTFCIPTVEDKDTENHSPDIKVREKKVERAEKRALPNFMHSGAFCEECKTELALSASGKGYFCPNWKDAESTGKPHSRFAADKLEEFKVYQANKSIDF